MTDPTTPTTEAGRRLLAVSNGEDPILPDDWFGAILAIEAEAAASAHQFVEEGESRG